MCYIHHLLSIAFRSMEKINLLIYTQKKHVNVHSHKQIPSY